MRLLTIAQKALKEFFRDRQSFAVFMLFPAMMVAVYYLAFGPHTHGFSGFLKVAVLDEDRGPVARSFIAELGRLTFDEKPVFQLRHVTSRNEAETSLRENKLALLVRIPEGFSTTFSTGQVHVERTTAIELIGDLSTDAATLASGFLKSFIDQYQKQLVGWTKPARFEIEFLRGTGTLNDFQFGVPGLFIFGVMFAILTSAAALIREDVAGTLGRLKMSKVRTWELLAGLTTAQFILTSVQLTLTLLISRLFGIHSAGSIPVLFLIALILSLSAIGLGGATAALARTDSEAGHIGTGLMLPAVFLSGAIFALPQVPLFSFAGHAIGLVDLLPTTPAALAMRRVFIFGDGLGNLRFELLSLTFLSLLYWLLGILLYRQRRLARKT